MIETSRQARFEQAARYEFLQDTESPRSLICTVWCIRTVWSASGWFTTRLGFRFGNEIRSIVFQILWAEIMYLSWGIWGIEADQIWTKSKKYIHYLFSVLLCDDKHAHISHSSCSSPLCLVPFWKHASWTLLSSGMVGKFLAVTMGNSWVGIYWEFPLCTWAHLLFL